MMELRNVILTLLNLQSQIHAVTKSLNKVFENHKHIDELKYEGYLENRVTLSGSLNGILSNYTIILYCSFLDEYNQKFVVSNFDESYKDRIISCRKKNKPGLKRINQWPDLFDFRN